MRRSMVSGPAAALGTFTTPSICGSPDPTDRTRASATAFVVTNKCASSRARNSWWLWWRKRIYTTRLFLLAATCSIPVGYVAVTAGWVTTEVGRQPYVVYGHLRTADAVTPFLTSGDVIASLLTYIVVYSIVFGSGAFYLVRLVRKGFPADVHPHPGPVQQRKVA